MDPAALSALSPVDGRYRKAADALRAVLSESGLIRERVRIEAAWLLALAESVPATAQASRWPNPSNSSPRASRSNRATTPPAAVKAIESAHQP